MFKYLMPKRVKLFTHEENKHLHHQEIEANFRLHALKGRKVS